MASYIAIYSSAEPSQTDTPECPVLTPSNDHCWASDIYKPGGLSHKGDSYTGWVLEDAIQLTIHQAHIICTCHMSWCCAQHTPQIAIPVLD